MVTKHVDARALVRKALEKAVERCKERMSGSHWAGVAMHAIYELSADDAAVDTILAQMPGAEAVGEVVKGCDGYPWKRIEQSFGGDPLAELPIGAHVYATPIVPVLPAYDEARELPDELLRRITGTLRQCAMGFTGSADSVLHDLETWQAARTALREGK